MCLVLRILLALLLLSPRGMAREREIQFDVFVGYDAVVRPGAWNSVVVEIFNGGASRDGIIEVSSDRWGSAAVRVPIELPNNSRKRLAIPFFCTGVGVECRLLSPDGRVLEQRTGGQIQAIGWNAPLVGSLVESSQGGPSLPLEKTGDPEMDAPHVVRLRVEMFPDTALALESLSSIYVSPSKASMLSEGQVASLLQWVSCGGQLVVGLDRPGDLAAFHWLKPMGTPPLAGERVVLMESEMRRWIDRASWSPDFAFRCQSPPGKDAPQDVAPSATPGKDRWVEPIRSLSFLSVGVAKRGDEATPWMDVQPWGRGQVVVLGFDPEREPMRSWDLRTRFWSKLLAIPPRLGSASPPSGRVLTGSDSLFADLVDTRQVRKLPISILLALLVLYLAVIGPGDRWILARVHRPMLTWLTFPTYVVLFAGLIYLIGFRLRSGQTEWNEFQVVDVIPGHSRDTSVLRCRTYGGLYSPATGVYPLELGVSPGGIRSELRNLFGVRLDSGRVITSIGSKDTRADVQASLWMKNLVVAEWIDEAEAPIVALDRKDGSYEIQNRTGTRLGPVWLAHGGRVRVVETLQSGGVLEWRPGQDSGSLDELIGPALAGLHDSMGRRERAPAGESATQGQDHSSAAMAYGFCGRVDASMPEDRAILWPRGFDLANQMDSGRLVVLAWVSDPGLASPLNRFPAARGHRDCLLRLTVPLQMRPPASPSQ